MKRTFVLLFAAVALLASCGPARRIARSVQTVRADSVVERSSTVVAAERVVDTTRTESGTITITEIDFFETATVDTAKAVAVVSGRAQLSDVGTFTGVRSVKQTVIERAVEQRGESRERKDSTTVASREMETHEEIVLDEVTQKPASRWPIVVSVILAVVAVAVLIYVNRAPILNWLRRILAGVLKIL